MMDARQVPFLPLTSTEKAIADSNHTFLPLLVMPEGTPGTPEHNDALDKLFHRLHDALWQNGTANHPSYVRNPTSNYSVFEGNLDATNHRDVVAPWGASGLQVLQPYSFFSANENILSGMLQQAGLPFSTVTKGPAWEGVKREMVSRQGAEETLRMSSAAIQQSTGQNVAPAMTDEQTHVPETQAEWEAPLPEQQQLESEVFERLNEALTLNQIQPKLLDNFRDKFIVGDEIGHVFARNGQPDYERLERNEVSFWGPVTAQNADDMDAWQIRRQINISQVIAKYGAMLKASGTMEETMKMLGSLASGPYGGYTATKYTDGTLSRVLASDQSPFLAGYDSSLRNGPITSTTEQILYVKLIENFSYRVLTDVDMEGAPIAVRPLTEDEYQKYTDGRYPYFERLIYQRLTEEKAKEARDKGQSSIKTIMVCTLWHSVRLGSKLLFRRPLPWQEREPGKLATPSFPITASFGKDTSMVSKGLALHELYTNVMITLRKKVAMSGTQAVGYDISQLPKGYSIERVMYEAKEVGIMFFNGARIGGTSSKEAYRHLQPVELGLDDELPKLLAFAGILHDMFDRLCGITPALKGMFQNRETNGQSQMGMSRGTLATNRIFYEHSLYVEQVLNRMVSLGKYLWSRQSSPRAKGATLDTVRQLPLHYYGIYLENSLKSREDKEFITNLAQSAVSSGGASLSEIMRIYFAETPAQAMSLFEGGQTAFEKLQAEQQQMQSQTQQTMAQMEQMKVDMPLRVAQLQGQLRIELEKLKQQYESGRQADDLAFKGDLADITNQNNIQRDLIKEGGQQDQMLLGQAEPAM